MAFLNQSLDFILSVFEYHTNPPLGRLFNPKRPFEWDKSMLVPRSKFNNNLVLPTLWDPTTGGIPEKMFQSGYGFGDNIELDSVKIKRIDDTSTWTPRIKHGTFFSRNVPYYLYSDESATDILSEEYTDDGRSRIDLKYRPKPGVPISVQILELDANFNVTINSSFRSVGRFTGIVQNGTELDTSENENIDTSVKEFIVYYNPNNVIKDWRIRGPVGPGVVTLQLPDVPIEDYPVFFTRKDIFQRKKFLGSTYEGAFYSAFVYGTSLEAPGDYMIDYTTGEVHIWLDAEYSDLGYVTFTNDYPAYLEFNDSYIVDYGSSITAPTISDLNDLVRGPQSDGLANQIVPIGPFPIIDLTDERTLDVTSFHLFIYDSSSQTFDNDWERVLNLEDSGPTDKHYVLDSETGTLFFGDGVTGAIPPIFDFFYFGLKTSVRVEYEPIEATDYWTDRTRDLYPLHNNLNSGFLYLSRKEIVPNSLVIRFPVEEITTLESAPLTITVVDREFEPVPNALVELSIEGNIGSLEDSQVITDSNGEARTFYVPSSDIEDMGVIVHFFESNPGSPGAEINPFSTKTLTNDTITLPEDISADSSDIFLFKIYADVDPYNEYDHYTRTGGQYLLHYEYDAGSDTNEIIRPIAASKRVLVFDHSLPQPIDPLGPNYEENLRGYAIIAKKEIRVQGTLDFKNNTLFSNVERLLVGYSPIQRGEWTLPILPTDFTSSEIDRAIWITINPS